MSAISDGQIVVDLGDETVTLVPTLAAIEAINRHAGDIATAIAQVRKMDFDTVAAAVVAGAGASGARAKALREAVFKTGVIRVAVPVAEFVVLLANGGRPVRDDEDDRSGDGGDGPGNG